MMQFGKRRCERHDEAAPDGRLDIVRRHLDLDGVRLLPDDARCMSVFVDKCLPPASSLARHLALSILDVKHLRVPYPDRSQAETGTGSVHEEQVASGERRQEWRDREGWS